MIMMIVMNIGIIFKNAQAWLNMDSLEASLRILSIINTRIMRRIKESKKEINFALKHSP